MSLKDNLRTLLKVILSFIFLLAGLVKIIPNFHPDTYLLMDQNFKNVFGPLWREIVVREIGYEIEITPVLFKQVVGGIELLIVGLLWGSGKIPLIGSLFGMIVMTGAVITHIKLDEDYLFPLGLGVVSLLIFVLSLGGTGTKKSKSEKRKSN